MRRCAPGGARIVHRVCVAMGRVERAARCVEVGRCGRDPELRARVRHATPAQLPEFGRRGSAPAIVRVRTDYRSAVRGRRRSTGARSKRTDAAPVLAPDSCESYALVGPNRASQDAFLAALLSAPVMASASEVTLAGLSPGRAGTPLVPWLARSPFLRKLRGLNLSRNGFGDPEACDLAQNPRLAQVERLSLAHNRIGNAGALALAQSPHLRNVVCIDLASNRIGGDGLATLAARFGSGLKA